MIKRTNILISEVCCDGCRFAMYRLRGRCVIDFEDGRQMRRPIATHLGRRQLLFCSKFCLIEYVKSKTLYELQGDYSPVAEARA